jgi:TRAP-type uncharacterized transport system substrate-binding protein
MPQERSAGPAFRPKPIDLRRRSICCPPSNAKLFAKRCGTDFNAGAAPPTVGKDAMPAAKIHVARALAKLSSLFGRGMVVSLAAILLVSLAIAAAIIAFVNSSAPTQITLTSGPAGSVFERNAERYKKILAREGVTLKILPSAGSIENFKRLSDPKFAVDVGFVLGGEAGGADLDQLFSLGSIAYQPLMIFYQGAPRMLLSDFKGQRLDIGDEGSGTRILALALLKANGITPGDGTVLVDSAAGDTSQALRENRLDAIFMMGDSTSTELMRTLLHTPDIRLFNFTQADAYARRIAYLNKLELPKGSLDFGKNIPAEDISLIAPTVELVARKTLHPALSDILLEAAKEVHGGPGLFRKRGEFPAPVEHEFAISPDAARFYASGKGFLYRSFPFWIASLIARTLAVVLPLALLLFPALKLAPAIYKWRIQYRISRWYKVLLELERDALKPSPNPKRHEELLRHLAEIESAVNRITIPASFGDLFYELRVHIDFVRASLLAKHEQETRDRRSES